jgi:hypothetical protein
LNWAGKWHESGDTKNSQNHRRDSLGANHVRTRYCAPICPSSKIMRRHILIRANLVNLWSKPSNIPRFYDSFAPTSQSSTSQPSISFQIQIHSLIFRGGPGLESFFFGFPTTDLHLHRSSINF